MVVETKRSRARHSGAGAIEPPPVLRRRREAYVLMPPRRPQPRPAGPASERSGGNLSADEMRARQPRHRKLPASEPRASGRRRRPRQAPTSPREQAAAAEQARPPRLPPAEAAAPPRHAEAPRARGSKPLRWPPRPLRRRSAAAPQAAPPTPAPASPVVASAPARRPRPRLLARPAAANRASGSRTYGRVRERRPGRPSTRTYESVGRPTTASVRTTQGRRQSATAGALRPNPAFGDPLGARCDHLQGSGPANDRAALPMRPGPTGRPRRAIVRGGDRPATRPSATRPWRPRPAAGVRANVPARRAPVPGGRQTPNAGSGRRRGRPPGPRRLRSSAPRIAERSTEDPDDSEDDFSQGRRVRARPSQPHASGEPKRREGRLTIQVLGRWRRGRRRAHALAGLGSPGPRTREGKAPRWIHRAAPNAWPREVVIPDVITVQELSNRMAVRGVDIIKFLMKSGPDDEDQRRHRHRHR